MTQNLTGESHQPGRIEVVCGSMFSGKTEELIRRMKRARFAQQRLIIFKPAMDTRYSEENVVSHDHNAIPSTPVKTAAEILEKAGEVDVVGIDEAQFFDDGIVNVCDTLASRGIRVIVAGLDMDYQCKPFGAMPQLLSIADDVLKVHAICIRCGRNAYVSHRKVDVDGQVLLGERKWNMNPSVANATARNRRVSKAMSQSCLSRNGPSPALSHTPMLSTSDFPLP